MGIRRGNKTQGHLLNEESKHACRSTCSVILGVACQTMLTYQYVFKPTPLNKKNDEDHIHGSTYESE
jgi:hypothetical protein